MSLVSEYVSEFLIKFRLLFLFLVTNNDNSYLMDTYCTYQQGYTAAPVIPYFTTTNKSIIRPSDNNLMSVKTCKSEKNHQYPLSWRKYLPATLISIITITTSTTAQM